MPSVERVGSQAPATSPVRQHAAICTLAVVLAGCASAPAEPRLAQGSLPEPKVEHQSLGAPPFKARDDLLSDLERHADCKGLGLAVGRRIATVKQLQANMAAELKTIAPTVERMVQRASDPDGRGTYAHEQIVQERGAMRALNARLEAQHCATVDIDRAVATATTPSAKGCPQLPFGDPANLPKTAPAKKDGCV